MYIDVVPNRNSAPAILLRESRREGKKVLKKTIANISDWPQAKIDALRTILKGEPGPQLPDGFEVTRSRMHGHVVATLGSLRGLGLETLIAPKRSRERDLVVAMTVARIIEPGSKLSLARALRTDTLESTLGETLGLSDSNQDELYEAMDWLLTRQNRIEDALAKKHLSDGTFVLYDVSSTYFEGRKCPLGKLGHSRDGKSGKLQIVFGLLTNGEGCPVAVEVFEGNTGDPKTVAAQINKLRERFGLKRVIMVGDRGMLTSARIEQDLKNAPGLDWISCLRAPAIKKLVESRAIQLSLFDQRDLAEIVSPDFPDERLIACMNPLLAEDRKRKRFELLAATEKKLDKIKTATQRKKRPLRGKDKIALRVGKVLGHYKVGKHFTLQITDAMFDYKRDEESITSEALLDGIYVIRTSVAKDALEADAAVRTYKSLSQVERAFRSLKQVDLKVRPIGHWLEDRVRAHVFLCMLAYYVEWHMRHHLAPLLFDDDDKVTAQALRASVVSKAMRSPRARAKDSTKTTEDGYPVQSFQSLLKNLATIVKNRIQPNRSDLPAFDKVTTPTPLQSRAFSLLGLTVQL